MTREFIIVPAFDRRWSDIGLSDDNLRTLQNELLNNPLSGRIIKDTGGARKIRFALPGTGKSGGIRVIYLDITHLNQLYLILCYPKDKQESLTPTQKKQVKAVVEALKGV